MSMSITSPYISQSTQISSTLFTAIGTFRIAHGLSSSTNVVFNQTYYVSPEELSLKAAEANADQTRPGIDCTSVKIMINITSNTLDGDTVITLRDDGVDTAGTLTISAADTGFKTATIDVDHSADDKLTFKIDSTASTAGSMGVNFMGLILEGRQA